MGTHRGSGFSPFVMLVRRRPRPDRISERLVRVVLEREAELGGIWRANHAAPDARALGAGGASGTGLALAHREEAATLLSRACGHDRRVSGGEGEEEEGRREKRVQERRRGTWPAKGRGAYKEEERNRNRDWVRWCRVRDRARGDRSQGSSFQVDRGRRNEGPATVVRA